MDHTLLFSSFRPFFKKPMNKTKFVIRRSFAATLIGILYLGQVAPCLVITGCSKNHNGTKPETAPTTDRATAQDGGKVARAARDQEIAQTSNALTTVARANREKEEAIAETTTEKKEAVVSANEAVVEANTEKVARANEAIVSANTERATAATKIQATFRSHRVRKKARDAAETANTASVSRVATTTGAITQLQALVRGNRAQEEVISQQDAALLAGAAVLGEYMTNRLFTWQSKSK